MTGIPQAAIDAGADTLADALRLSDIEEATAVARVVIEAAAPLIAAAERERIRQLAIDRNASYVIDCGDPGCPGSHAHMSDEVAPFAGLLTEGDTT